MEHFDESYDMGIHDLISQLLLIQQKRLVRKDDLFSDESLTNFYIHMPQKGDLFEYIFALKRQIANMLSDLEEE